MIGNIIGRLGKDAESITSKNGSTFVRYSLASDEYNSETKQRETVWYSVIDSTDFGKKNLQYLKKGTMISLVGNYTPSLYEYNGEKRIDHKVSAYAWSFVSTGSKSSEQTQNTQTTTHEATSAPTSIPPIVQPSMGAFKQPTPSANTATEPNPAEDLPF
jgi:single-stranded DNA-binding protein